MKQQNPLKSWNCFRVLTLPTSGGGSGKLILINGTNQTVKATHNVINAAYHYSISGVLKEHLKWPLCKKTLQQAI